MKAVLFANHKGGCGKTTLAQHVCAAAAEAGLAVAAWDCDRQGDLHRRLSAVKDRPEAYEPVEWAPGSWCWHSPGAWGIAARDAARFALSVVDTPPATGFPQGAVPELVVVPIDGYDAALNAGETVQAALDWGVPRIVMVRTGTSEVSRKFRKEFAELGRELPERVSLCGVELPRSASIKATAHTCRPAWQAPMASPDVRALRAVCHEILTAVGVALARRRAAR